MHVVERETGSGHCALRTRPAPSGQGPHPPDAVLPHDTESYEGAHVGMNSRSPGALVSSRPRPAPRHPLKQSVTRSQAPFGYRVRARPGSASPRWRTTPWHGPEPSRVPPNLHDTAPRRRGAAFLRYALGSARVRPTLFGRTAIHVDRQVRHRVTSACLLLDELRDHPGRPDADAE